MKILLTGKNGQVGYELERSLQGLGELIVLDRNQMDLGNLAQVRDVIRSVKPDLIVNPAAYTAVDKAESEPDLAMRINGEAPAVMAEEAKRLGAAMIHYSTDYVFDGKKAAPYTENDMACPINTYGRTKLFGEQAIQDAGIRYLIFRTSWVYGMRGKNFLLTMLRLAGERKELSIVADQYGAPTWSRTIADTTAKIITQALSSKSSDWWSANSGLYHLTAQGKTNWYEFAQAIFDSADIETKPLLSPIKAEDYPLPAERPTFSVLSCERMTTTFGRLPEWRDGLRLCME